MSYSLPSRMSRFAYTPRDMSYQTSRNNYSDFSGGNNFASAGHASSSTSSLTDLGGNTNLIINYLPQDMSEQELFQIFRSSGPIDSCRIIRDYKTGYSFGYAFINYQTDEDAMRAINTLNGVTIRNKRLKVSFARPSGDDIKETNLYVTNLPRTITESQLDQVFGRYGLIVQKNILRDKMTGLPRGVAFVRFNKRDEAQDAIAALNNTTPDGFFQAIGVRVAEEHGKAKAQSFMPMVGNNNVMHRGRQFRMQKPHPYGNRN